MGSKPAKQEKRVLNVSCSQVRSSGGRPLRSLRILGAGFDPLGCGMWDRSILKSRVHYES